MDYSVLMEQAAKARNNAYAPYSSFKVGAAALTKSGKIYLGCNVENAAYGDTVCAERVALFKAISEGEREFAAIAIVGGKDEPVFCSPCGSCRQALSEFCDGDCDVVIGTPNKIEVYKLKDLLPLSFSLEKDL